MLSKDGILIVVSFHSLEDRIVKYFFNIYSNLKKNPSRYFPANNNEYTLFKLLSKKPMTPNKNEVIQNFRSRSAKLRYAIRNNNSFFHPKELKIKFNKYFKMEEVKLWWIQKYG